MNERTERERLIVIEEAVLRIEGKVDRFETRILRMEWLGGVVTGVFSALAIYFKGIFSKA